MRRRQAAAATIQRVYRGHVGRLRAKAVFKDLLTTFLAITTAQRAVRRWVARRNRHKVVEEQREASTTIQSYYRGYIQRKELGTMEKSATTIQSYLRGHQQRVRLATLTRSVVTAQRVFRGYYARKNLKAMIRAIHKILQVIIRTKSNGDSFSTQPSTSTNCR